MSLNSAAPRRRNAHPPPALMVCGALLLAAMHAGALTLPASLYCATGWEIGGTVKATKSGMASVSACANACAAQTGCSYFTYYKNGTCSMRASPWSKTSNPSSTVTYSCSVTTTPLGLPLSKAYVYEPDNVPNKQIPTLCAKKFSAKAITYSTVTTEKDVDHCVGRCKLAGSANCTGTAFNDDTSKCTLLKSLYPSSGGSLTTGPSNVNILCTLGGDRTVAGLTGEDSVPVGTQAATAAATAAATPKPTVAATPTPTPTATVAATVNPTLAPTLAPTPTATAAPAVAPDPYNPCPVAGRPATLTSYRCAGGWDVTGTLVSNLAGPYTPAQCETQCTNTAGCTFWVSYNDGKCSLRKNPWTAYPYTSKPDSTVNVACSKPGAPSLSFPQSYQTCICQWGTCYGIANCVEGFDVYGEWGFFGLSQPGSFEDMGMCMVGCMYNPHLCSYATWWRNATDNSIDCLARQRPYIYPTPMPDYYNVQGTTQPGSAKAQILCEVAGLGQMKLDAGRANP